MTELQKLVHGNNGNFKSDLMKVFVGKLQSDFSKTGASPTSHSDVLTTNLNQNVKTGACIFTTTTTITSTLTSADNTDNANILKARDVTDNQTTTTSTITTANTTDNRTSPLIMQQIGTNDNINANANKPSITFSSPETPDPNANISEVAAILDEVKKPVSDIRSVLVQQVTEATVDAHISTCINTHKAVADTKTRLMALKESEELADLSKLSISASSMWQHFTEQMKPELTKVIKFCKMLPGFSEISGEDQMKLIKLSSFEVMLTRFSMLVDHEKEMMLDPSHTMCCPRHVVREMPMGKFLDGFFSVAARFNPLGLTDGEIALFTGILIFSPDRAGLKDTKVIAKVQSLYHQALFDLMKKNHSCYEDKFHQLLSLVPMFRSMNEKHFAALSSMRMDDAVTFDNQFPPLHHELYSERV